VSLNVFTYGTGVFEDETLIEMVKNVFDFRPYAMINNLKMLDLDYYAVSKYGVPICYECQKKMNAA
jgi:S-adenosylmethionine synthetase